MSDPVKRLYRSRRHRVIAGVCGGVAEYFALDPVIIRILWILFTIAGGAGLLTYIAALFIMENNPHEEVPTEEAPPHPSSQRAFWGTVLIVIGLVFMFTTFRWFYFPFFHIRWEIVLATILIAVGIAVILFGTAGIISRKAPADEKPEGEEEKKPKPKEAVEIKRLYRSRDQRIIFGICGGLGKYFDLDPVLIRLVWLLLSFFTGGAGFLVYLVLIFVIPEE